MVNILILGNPGVGKSTLINGFLGRPEFAAGVSYGGGLTQHLRKAVHGQDTYYDLPGLEDMRIQEQAAAEITNALQEGGDIKIVFLVAPQGGRVSPGDAVTMQTVLKAIPSVNGTHYGVIYNKLSKPMMKDLKGDTNKYGKLIDTTMSVIDVPLRTMHFHFEPRRDELESGDEVDYSWLQPQLLEVVAFLEKLKPLRLEPKAAQQVQSKGYQQTLKDFNQVVEKNRALEVKIHEKEQALIKATEEADKAKAAGETFRKKSEEAQTQAAEAAKTLQETKVQLEVALKKEPTEEQKQELAQLNIAITNAQATVNATQANVQTLQQQKQQIDADISSSEERRRRAEQDARSMRQSLGFGAVFGAAAGILTGVALAPFTGGLSLGLTAAGFGAASAVGAATGLVSGVVTRECTRS